ncbi:MAC/perforin domain-containing protein [Paracraurococcus ruber]|uniref:MACPF domain-containing protein n=1 Tax=Paracraurococcus ruber TaxID=77675 RepID=A0ABS1D6W3_9PROT|nr:MAC/perforin domain-containing protein [Paracraurococcus ruber]MBK1662215.1 hypothetical protein [Paracraurococcus ruber]TDG14306.1 hypothetical protein E2C05_30060 [Paracraurococcus ruber]
MSDADGKMIPNIEYLGRCYDVLKTDPLSLGETALPLVFDFGGETYRTSLGYLVPKGVIHSAPSSTRFLTESRIVSSTFEFQDSFSSQLSMNAGVEGVFEFSASASYRQVESQTQSRKYSYLYSRAHRVENIVKLDLLNRNSGLRLTEAFRQMVADLPPPEAPEADTAYANFVAEFGTHVTTEIRLGGAAVQTTRAASSRVLKSQETESNFTAKANAVIEAVSAGASVEQATKQTRSSDQAEEYERSQVDFQGGLGTTGGITNEWLASIAAAPVIIAAQFADITSLLTADWFPEDEFIAAKQLYVSYAIRDHILEKGRRGDVNRPLRYGERLVMLLARNDNTLGFPQLEGGDAPVLAYPAARTDQRPTAVALEPYDKTRADRPVLSGDAVRIRLLATGKYLSRDQASGGLAFNAAQAGAVWLRLTRSDENAAILQPSGLVFSEMDKLHLSPSSTNPGSIAVGIDAAGNRLMARGNVHAPFRLMRVPEPGKDD